MNTADKPEDRRRMAAEALRIGLDEKCQYASREWALAHLERAYELSTKPTPLMRPWPQLTAYRLAHMLLRAGSTVDLEKVEKLLVQARDSILGPLPYVYQLAVLHRMETSKGADQRAINARIQDVFKLAYKELSRTTHYAEFGITDVETLNEDEDDIGHESTARRAGHSTGYERLRTPILQYNAFNLLELAAYFIGHDIHELSGQAVSDEILCVSELGQWQLVGTGIAPIRCAERIVLEELSQRAKMHKPNLVIRLPEVGKQAGYWKDGVFRDLNYKLAALILYPIATKPRNHRRDCLIRDVFLDPDSSASDGENAAGDLYRQTVSRGKKTLRELTGLPADEVLIEDNRAGFHVLNRNINVLAAVSRESVLFHSR